MCRVIDKRREKAKKTVVTATVKSQSFLTNEFKGMVTYKKTKTHSPPGYFHIIQLMSRQITTFVSRKVTNKKQKTK